MKQLNFHQPLLRNTYKRFSPLITNRKTASYLTLTLTLLSLSFFGIFAVRPTLITAVSLFRSVSDLKQLNTEYEQKIGDIIRAQAEYEKILNDIPVINGSLPQNPAFSQVAGNIEKFASREGFTITQLQIDNVPISTPSSTNRISEFGFRVIGTGDYQTVMAFFSHLLNWRRIVSINSFDMTPEGSTNSGTLRLSLRALTYYEP
ncbi:type 4a pilus biogenesis protein PilO [Candidatus Gottesmanbacteria bacterium]|nr:type 4a pilus biogenesis protein PilO [Candidatus Gottesmanbacteria bacterium]